jgi:hypothetical protein
MTLTHNVARSTFLDEFGRYAKAPAAIHTVRLELSDGTIRELTTAEYNTLSPADREYINTLPSGHIDTEGKSNA